MSGMWWLLLAPALAGIAYGVHDLRHPEAPSWVGWSWVRMTAGMDRLWSLVVRVLAGAT